MKLPELAVNSVSPDGVPAGSVTPASTSCCGGGPPPVNLASRPHHLAVEAGVPVWGLVAILFLRGCAACDQPARHLRANGLSPGLLHRLADHEPRNVHPDGGRAGP